MGSAPLRSRKALLALLAFSVIIPGCGGSKEKPAAVGSGGERESTVVVSGAESASYKAKVTCGSALLGQGWGIVAISSDQDGPHSQVTIAPYEGDGVYPKPSTRQYLVGWSTKTGEYSSYYHSTRPDATTVSVPKPRVEISNGGKDAKVRAKLRKMSSDLSGGSSPTVDIEEVLRCGSLGLDVPHY